MITNKKEHVKITLISTVLNSVLEPCLNEEQSSITNIFMPLFAIIFDINLFCFIVESGKVYGADISHLAHYNVEELLFEELASRKVELYHSSVSHLPFNSLTVDKAFSCNCFYFWPDIPKGCYELHRVLKPGGLLLTVQNIQAILKRKRAGGFENANTDFVMYMSTLEMVGFSDVRMEYCKDEDTGKSYEVIHAVATKDDTSIELDEPLV